MQHSMSLPYERNVLFFLLLIFCGTPSGLIAQIAPDAAQHLKHKQAADLFNQGKPLESLPLPEELEKAKPRSLLALAACLTRQRPPIRRFDA